MRVTVLLPLSQKKLDLGDLTLENESTNVRNVSSQKQLWSACHSQLIDIKVDLHDLDTSGL